MALMAMAPSLSGAGSSGSTTPFLLIRVKGAQVKGAPKKNFFGTHRTRFFVECVYGRDAARTGSLPGPSPFFDQAFKLPLDGRASSVAITLKRERSGGKEPASLGGLTFAITPDIERAEPVERDWVLGGGSILQIHFDVEGQRAAYPPPRPKAQPRPTAQQAPPSPAPSVGGTGSLPFAPVAPPVGAGVVEAGPAIAADPESSLGSSFSSRRGSMVDVPFEDASEAARREDEEDDVPPRRERIKEAPLPLPAPGDAAAEGKRGFACGSIGALLGCLPPNVSNPERGGTTESWTCRWGFWDAKL